MKKLAFIIALTASLSFTSSAYAGAGTGKIDRILVQQPNFVFFSLVDKDGVQNHTGAPACQGGSNEFSIDISEDNALGQAQYAFLMMAEGLDKTVRAVGTNACTTGPGRETVNFIFFDD